MVIVPYDTIIKDVNLEWYDIVFTNDTITFSNAEKSTSFSCCDIREQKGNIKVSVVAPSSASSFSFAFDHAYIIAKALERLRGKLSYTDLLFTFVKEEFTLPDLQRIYEVILNKKVTSKTQFKSSLIGKIRPLDRKGKSVIGNKLSMLYKYVYG